MESMALFKGPISSLIQPTQIYLFYKNIIQNLSSSIGIEASAVFEYFLSV